VGRDSERSWFEIRVREEVSPGRFVKKSKFFYVRNSQEAAQKYSGPGHIMASERVKREKALGIGEFFTLGPRLLLEFRQLERLEADKKSSVEALSLELGIKKNEGRGSYGKSRRKTSTY
jgi:hypothetical protein